MSAFININENIFLCGHKGMVGKSIYSNFKKKKYLNIITRTKTQLNLTNQKKVDNFFKNNQIDVVIIAAAQVGGILFNANNNLEQLYKNSMIELNVINAAKKNKIKKLIFLGSSCAYPKLKKMPITEDKILKSELEKTNEGYALSKILGIKLCEYISLEKNYNYIALMPCNLYGPNDNFELKNSHVLPALIAKIYLSQYYKHKSIKIWGNGKSLREFLYVDDLALAILHIAQLKKKDLLKLLSNSSLINVGSGREISIIKLARLIQKTFNYNVPIDLDLTKPKGVHRKVISSKKLNNVGWYPSITLEEGIKKTIIWYQKKNR